MFYNSQVEIDSIPILDEARLINIEKKYFKIITGNLIIIYFLFYLLLMVIAWFVSNEKQLLIYIIFISSWLVFVAQFILYKIGFKYRRYALREHDIIYTSGLIKYITITIPFNRIQHVELSRSFLERKLNLASIHIYTAGDVGGDLKIRGISNEVAQTINSFLIGKLINDN